MYKFGIKKRLELFKKRYFFNNLSSKTLVIDIGSHIGEFPLIHTEKIKHIYVSNLIHMPLKLCKYRQLQVL